MASKIFLAFVFDVGHPVVAFVIVIGNVENFPANKPLLIQRESVPHFELELCVVWQAFSLCSTKSADYPNRMDDNGGVYTF
jgi:hypothetical protein